MVKALSLTMKRALIKRFEGLPNVSEFRTEKLGIHEYAAYYGVEKIMRSYRVKKMWDRPTPNIYLERQMKRISEHVIEGRIERAQWLAYRILTRSVVYRVLAMNRTCPDWFLWNARTLRRVWTRLSKICREGSTELRFRRFWIEKKKGSGIFERPIGAPHKEWRMYAYMQSDLMERILMAQGMLTDWQHGGRSSKGLVTAWSSLITKLGKRNIYEFDLKGFFDNLNHEAIEEYLYPKLGKEFSKLVAGTLMMKNMPTETYLPPKDQDDIIERVKAAEEKIEPITTEIELEAMLKMQQKIMKEYSRILGEDYLTKEWILEGEKLADPEYLPGMIINPGLRKLFEEYPSQYDWTHKAAKEEQRLVDKRNQSLIWVIDLERALAREEWKGLLRATKGVPQGLAWSPLISTCCLEQAVENNDKTLSKKLLMYMDDGLLFADTKEELEEAIASFKEIVKGIGIEIAEEKSGIVKEEGKWLKERTKFLGLEYVATEDNLVSKTRSGTVKSLPIKGSEDQLKTIQGWHKEVEHPYMTRQELDTLINTKGYEAGLKYGFLGCLISEAMDPNQKTGPGGNYAKQLAIEEGKVKKWGTIISKSGGDWVTDAKYDRNQEEGYIWKFQDLHPVKRDLTNISSVATFSFLAPLERELGLRETSRSRRIKEKSRKIGRLGETLGSRGLRGSRQAQNQQALQTLKVTRE